MKSTFALVLSGISLSVFSAGLVHASEVAPAVVAPSTGSEMQAWDRMGCEAHKVEYAEQVAQMLDLGNQVANRKVSLTTVEQGTKGPHSIFVTLQRTYTDSTSDYPVYQVSLDRSDCHLVRIKLLEVKGTSNFQAAKATVRCSTSLSQKFAYQSAKQVFAPGNDVANTEAAFFVSESTQNDWHSIVAVTREVKSDNLNSVFFNRSFDVRIRQKGCQLTELSAL